MAPERSCVSGRFKMVRAVVVNNAVAILYPHPGVFPVKVRQEGHQGKLSETSDEASRICGYRIPSLENTVLKMPVRVRPCLTAERRIDS